MNHTNKMKEGQRKAEMAECIYKLHMLMYGWHEGHNVYLTLEELKDGGMITIDEHDWIRDYYSHKEHL